MSQNILTALIVGIALVISAWLISTSTTTISTSPTIRTLATSADAQVKVTPDTVVVSAGVEIRGKKTQEQAYTEMNTSISQVKSMLKALGIEDRFIQTSNLYVWAEYSYPEGRQVFDWYQASSTLSIRIEKKDDTVTNSLLDSLAKVSNIRVNGVSYDLSDKEAAYAEARNMALAKAKSKATEMARAAGVSIVSVQSISESVWGGAMPYYQNVRSMDMVMEKSSETDISLGQVEYTASVQVTYEIR